ncbi:MAG: TonB-dependent receptor [Candidatus Latescibacterota bacterium]
MPIPASMAGALLACAAAMLAPQGSWAQDPGAPRGALGYMNLSFSTLVDIGGSTASDVRAVQFGDHDPAQHGFTLPNSEVVFEGAVDPYLKGLADIVFKLDEGAETTVELEETYLQTQSLPLGLQVRAGHWFTEFGRHNPLHPHQWAFVDQPLVLGRMFGPEGLRNPGVRISWLAPTPFYAEAYLAVLNGSGGIAWSFRNPESAQIHGGEALERRVEGLGDLLYVPRLAASFDVGETQTLLLGASGAMGPNASGEDASTAIWGADLYWTWRPVNATAGYPFASLQGEVMLRRYEAAARTGADEPTGSGVPLPAETLQDAGFYAQVLWGFRRRWVLGLRGEGVWADDGAFDSALRQERTRLSPNLTWYPSEFSKLRLQYNYDRRPPAGDEHSLWLQLEFLLGAHGAHKF